MVFGVRRTPVPAQPWGVTTQNATTLFLHVLAPETLPQGDGRCKLIIPLPEGTNPSRKGAVSLLSGTPLSYDLSKDGFLTITLPSAQIEDIDTVIAVTK